MPFDIKSALERVDSEKRSALESALKESQGFIDSIEEVSTKLEAETKAKAELAAKVDEIQKNYDTAYAEYEKMVDDLDASEKDRKLAAEKLSKVEKEKLEAQAKLAEQLKSRPEFDGSKYLTVEDAKRLEAGRMGYMTKTLRAVQQHRELFNADLDPESLVIEAQAAQKTPYDFWEEKYKVKEKRESIAKESAEKRDQQLREEGYQKAIAESRNPALRTLESSDDPFYVPKSGEKVVQPWELPDGFVPEDEQKFLKEVTTKVQ